MDTMACILEDLGFSIGDKEEEEEEEDGVYLYMMNKKGNTFMLIQSEEDQILLYNVLSIPEDERWKPERLKKVIQQLNEEYFAKILLIGDGHIASVASFHANSARSFRYGISYAIEDAETVAKTFAIMMNTKQ